MNFNLSVTVFIILALVFCFIFLSFNLNYNPEFNKKVNNYATELGTLSTRYTLANEMVTQCIDYFQNSSIVEKYILYSKLEKQSKMGFVYKLPKMMLFGLIVLYTRSIYKQSKYKNIF